MSVGVEQVDEFVPSWDTPQARRAWRRRTSLEMIVSGFIGLVTSFVLSIEAWQLAADSSARFGCDVSAVLSCSTVAQTWQARILGFPNAFLGLIAEPVVMTIAVASLCGTRFPRWFMFTANVVYFLGVVFAYWLLVQSTFVIGALCPWCILVTISTTFVFWSMTHWNILEGNLYVSEGVLEKLRKFVRDGWMTITLIAWLAVVVAIEVMKMVLKVI